MRNFRAHLCNLHFFPSFPFPDFPWRIFFLPPHNNCLVFPLSFFFFFKKKETVAFFGKSATLYFFSAQSPSPKKNLCPTNTECSICPAMFRLRSASKFQCAACWLGWALFFLFPWATRGRCQDRDLSKSEESRGENFFLIRFPLRIILAPIFGWLGEVRKRKGKQLVRWSI